MTHEELKEKLLKAIGGKLPISARETWGSFQRDRATSFYVNYDWIKNNAFWQWVNQCEDVSAGLGGASGTTIEIVKFGCIGHDK